MVAGEYARRLAALPTIGVGHIKSQINDAIDSSFEQVWKNEVTLLGIGIGSDSEEAIQAFAERRGPRFTGRSAGNLAGDLASLGNRLIETAGSERHTETLAGNLLSYFAS